jgi:hypothetical protein
MEWQPIETAPKNRDVLLFCPRRGIVCGEWNTDRYAKNPRPYWSNDRERMFGTRETRDDQPTHWQPLPLPPNIEITGRTLAQNEADGA